MLYITKEKEVYYYIPNSTNEVFYDLYTFPFMTRTEDALQQVINLHFDLFRVEKYSPNKDDRYTLTLNFLSNARNAYINAIIDNFTIFINENRFKFLITENPLNIIIENLEINDVINLIQDNHFQSINSGVSSLHSSTWHFTLN